MTTDSTTPRQPDPSVAAQLHPDVLASMVWLPLDPRDYTSADIARAFPDSAARKTVVGALLREVEAQLKASTVFEAIEESA